MSLSLLYVLWLELPSLHLDWNLNIGNVALILIFLAIIRKLMPLYRLLLAWQAEHELFLEDYAERHELSVEEVHGLALARVRAETKRAKAASAR